MKRKLVIFAFLSSNFLGRNICKKLEYGKKNIQGQKMSFGTVFFQTFFLEICSKKVWKFEYENDYLIIFIL